MILGLDLSIASTGYAIFDTQKQDVIKVGTIKTSSKDSTQVRLHKIRKTLQNINNTYDISLVVIERGFTRFNNATQQLYRVHGIANELFWEVKQVYYTPSQVKKYITGNGRAGKQEVFNVVNEYFTSVAKNNDESDAVGLIITHLQL